MVVVAALGGAAIGERGAANAGASIPCPAEWLCIASRVPSAADLATASTACADDLAASWRDAARAGARAVAVSAGFGVVGERASDETRAAVRGVLTAAEIAARTDLELVVTIDASGLSRGCDASAVRRFVRLVAAGLEEGERAGARLFCSAGADGESSELPAGGAGIRRFDEMAVAPLGRSRSGGRGASGASRERRTLAVVNRRFCGDAATQIARMARAQTGLVGYVVPSPEAGGLAGNGDFADGWNAWETDGPLALTVPRGSRPDRCAPLVASLGPGSSIRQRIRLPEAFGRRLSFELRTDPGSQGAVVFRVAGGARRIEIGPGDTRARGEIEVRPGRRTVVLAVERPADEVRPIALRRVALGRDELRDAGACASVPERVVRLTGDTDRAQPNAGSGVSLVSLLPAAHVSAGGADTVWVERFPEHGESVGILAHPGAATDTQITVDVPPMGCARELRAVAAIAPACRARSDGATFVAGVRGRRSIAAIGGPPAKRGATMRLSIDAAGDGASSASRSVALSLTTGSGAARNADCDWAVWLRPTIACVGSATPPSVERERRAFGAPTSARRSRRRTIDLSAPAGPEIATRWDEVNGWKLYVLFGPRRLVAPATAGRPGWLRELVPWATHLRVMAATGGNTCKHIRDDCEHGIESLDHPFSPGHWECRDRRAGSLEILQDEEPTTRLDFTAWRGALDELAESGLRPHVNFSAVPCALAGGHQYRMYHWNQKPVADREGWRAFVDAVAAEIARRPDWSAWRFSILNEPNCLWIQAPSDPTGEAPPIVYRLGFDGTSAQYAEHFAATSTALRARLPGLEPQLGNYTVGGQYPMEDTLPEYLGALTPAISRSGLSSTDFAALSFSLYETPQHRLDDIATYKFARLERAVGRRSRFHGLPVKLDEVEIHPFVVDRFRERTGEELDATRWGGAWHADFLALAIDRNVASLAPWLGRLFADPQLAVPDPKYWTYALASLAAGDVVPDRMPVAEATALRPAPHSARRARLVSVRRSADDPDRLGWIATEDGHGDRWLLLWRHLERPHTDAEADDEPGSFVRVGLGTTCGAAATAEVLTIGPTPEGATPWHIAPFTKSGVWTSVAPVRDGVVHLRAATETVQLLRVKCGR
ncbi:MAG TPA: hypothetical protein VFD92_26070 [Candidatus Binatia bacterium]|nr:hypothetical protein [Candidatus Binatia bacterium]